MTAPCKSTCPLRRIRKRTLIVGIALVTSLGFLLVAMNIPGFINHHVFALNVRNLTMVDRTYWFGIQTSTNVIAQVEGATNPATNPPAEDQWLICSIHSDFLGRIYCALPEHHDLATSVRDMNMIFEMGHPTPEARIAFIRGFREKVVPREMDVAELAKTIPDLDADELTKPIKLDNIKSSPPTSNP